VIIHGIRVSDLDTKWFHILVDIETVAIHAVLALQVPDAAPDNVMQRPGGIYSGLSWHAPFIAEAAKFVNMQIYRALLRPNCQKETPCIGR
jgi:hypothetical protein